MNWKQFDQQRWQFLRYARREFRRALARQSAKVIQAIRDKGLHDTEGAIDLLVDKEPMKEAFVKVYRRVGGHFAKQTFSQFAKSEDEIWMREILNWIETEGADKITGITSTTKKQIKDILSKGTTEGLSIDEIAREISSKVGGMNRATLIARTEIISASNLGSIEGARSTGLPMKKIWLSTQDDRTRGMKPDDIFDHTDVKPVESLDALFIVSGEQLEYPGDSSHGASLGNFINCRCAIGYEPY